MIIFSIILIIALILPEIFQRFKITHIPFYIVAGIIIGPFGIGITPGEALIFMGDIGLFLLIFLAGLEIFESKGKDYSHSVFFALVMGGISFSAGFILGLSFQYPVIPSLLWGLVLMSSSVGECIPIINSSPAIKKKFGSILIPALIILDGSSLLGLGILLKQHDANSAYELGTFFVMFLVLLAFSLYVLPKMLNYTFRRKSRKPRESDVKFILFVLIAIVVISEFIGVHGIVTAFIVGVIMGEFMTGQKLYQKIHGIGHGLFIPLFFVVIGMRLDISIVFEDVSNIILPAALISVLVTAKIGAGSLFAFSRRWPLKDGATMGITLWPQLSATLAATAIGFETGIFPPAALLAVVVMAIFSTITTPLVVRFVTREYKRKWCLSDHIVIVGYGRTSSKIVSMLSHIKKDFVVIDNKINKIEDLEKRKIKSVYGEGDDKDILQQACIEKANIALITIGDDHEIYICAKRIRELNPSCYIIAKVHTQHVYNMLKEEELANSYLWPEKMSAREATEIVFNLI